jgi:hypothetical protein
MAEDDNRQEGLNSLSAASDDRIRFITARATVTETTGAAADDAVLQQAMRSASFMPMVTDGEPTKLLVTAWMVHEGKNNNNLVFRPEDLEPAAAKLASPNFLPMDWNHSAVIPKDGIPKAIGVWYSAEALYDEAAYEGRGALGIQAKGVVWAWAFPEYATEMLSIQRERGFIEFSMACIPTDVERGRDQNGAYEIAIDPVFFTLSALNVPPGDPDAKGVVENMEEVPRPAPLEWWETMAASAEEFTDGDLESEAAVEVLSGAKKSKTDFPTRGEDKAVSLRNSQWKLFPLDEAMDLKENWPEIWSRGGNIRGNDQFRRLTPVARRGGKVTTATEEYAVRLREAWVARHYEDFQLPGVIAQVKWLAIGSRGLDHMRSVINEAKERVKARRASARTEEETMENQNDMAQAALEAALEANAVLKAEVEAAGVAADEVLNKAAEMETKLAEMTVRAEEAELKRDALQAELAAAVEQLSAVVAEFETAKVQLAEIAAEQEKLAIEQRWTARFAELPESYRAAFGKRSEDEQDRFKTRWSVASDEAWGEFKSDLIVGFADTKISYLKLSEEEGALPAGSVTDLGAKVSALIK